MDTQTKRWSIQIKTSSRAKALFMENLEYRVIKKKCPLLRKQTSVAATLWAVWENDILSFYIVNLCTCEHICIHGTDMVFKLLEWGFLSDEAVVKKKINLDFIRAERQKYMDESSFILELGCVYIQFTDCLGPFESSWEFISGMFRSPTTVTWCVRFVWQKKCDWLFCKEVRLQISW